MDSPFQQYLQSFLSYLQFEKRYSQNTLVSYRNDLDQFFTYITDQYQATNLTSIEPIYVRSWLAELKAEKITAKTINRKASSLKSFFNYHLKTGSITATPMWAVTTPKISKRLPEFVKEKDMERMFTETDFPADWKGQTDYLLLLLFYQTGMRLSELVNLKESQVDFSKRVIKVLGKGNKERVVPVSEELVTALKAYQQAKRKEFEHFDSVHFFVLQNGKQLYTKYVYLAVKKYLSEITTLNKKSPHILRHTFATHLTNNGADLNAVKELLGHSSLAATQVYTHNSIEKLKEAHKKAHPRA
ncbi:MAG: tyrosine-type recombinase/integrase [Chitinophagaceae bacterium]